MTPMDLGVEDTTLIDSFNVRRMFNRNGNLKARCAAWRNARRAGHFTVNVKSTRQRRALLRARRSEGLMKSWSPVKGQQNLLTVERAFAGSEALVQEVKPISGGPVTVRGRGQLAAQSDSVVLVSTDRGRRSAALAFKSGLGGVPLLKVYF